MVSMDQSVHIKVRIQDNRRVVVWLPMGIMQIG